jgi:hypothetical protein
MVRIPVMIATNSGNVPYNEWPCRKEVSHQAGFPASAEATGTTAPTDNAMEPYALLARETTRYTYQGAGQSSSIVTC